MSVQVLLNVFIKMRKKIKHEAFRPFHHISHESDHFRIMYNGSFSHMTLICCKKHFWHENDKMLT